MDRERVLSTLFDQHKIAGLYLQMDAMMAMYATGATTGVAVQLEGASTLWLSEMVQKAGEEQAVPLWQRPWNFYFPRSTALRLLPWVIPIIMPGYVRSSSGKLLIPEKGLQKNL